MAFASLFAQYDRLVLTREAPPQTPAAQTLKPGETVRFGGWEISYLQGEEPVVIRSRQAGDQLCLPCGTKTVKKLFIERKIPREERETIPIVCQKEVILAVGDVYSTHLAEQNKKEIICRRI